MTWKYASKHRLLYHWATGPYWTSRLSCHMVELELSSCLIHYCQLGVIQLVQLVCWRPPTIIILLTHTYFQPNMRNHPCHREYQNTVDISRHTTPTAPPLLRYLWRHGNRYFHSTGTQTDSVRLGVVRTVWIASTMRSSRRWRPRNA